MSEKRGLRIRMEGEDVQFILDGKLMMTVPWHVAMQVSRETMRVAKLAEEFAGRDRLIYDQAIVIRAGGLPFHLTGNPDILQEAWKEAAWNSSLRRYLPGGIKSEEKMGHPALIKHPPTEAQFQAELQRRADQRRN